MQTLHQLPMTVRAAQATSRIITWGIRSDQRRELLLESDEDWELMYADLGPSRVLLRAARGVPSALLGRMDDRERTALPAAIAFMILAAAGLGAGLLERTYPSDIRRFVLISAIGLGLAGIVMARSPRLIPLRRLRIPMLVLFVGFLGLATNMPTEADWRYDSPMVGSASGDALMTAGFAVIAIGCLFVATATFRRSPRRTFLAGGATIVLGAILFGAGQIVWGVVAVTVDPAVTATSVTIGLGALSIAHVTPRLRYLVTD
ncbi:MAG: hypothetical protein GY722_18540 [bacterium]|nr:hypothetical protein [bacterium]